MRERFHGQLSGLGDRLSGMCCMACEELRLANRVFLDRDAEAAAELGTVEAKLNAARTECEEAAQKLLALQAPVARDLRTVLAAVYCADRLERMGDLARHIAEQAARAPEFAVPDALAGRFGEMAGLVVSMAEDLGVAIEGPTAEVFPSLARSDQRVDALYEELMTMVTAPDWADGVAPAISVALLARFYERFADQVVSVARRVDFALTGELPESSVRDVPAGL
ncbi:phosphate transport system regulatory protein PhoU [Amycolatopsis sp. WAC 01375]|uniref:phosphate signaling complex PhoU family protein n=1 Tax=Amycolatopsis sp. WAC 01375 TaxID=2203194 RepID=UPI000F7935A5|nr:PhoU domain-containing protein [Amycolatopsis sp. WAC 01375]RSM72411.1 phosphate transport system regulatory protein PhoU [Amycolatopsis sp. WAC 01375]